MVNVDMKILKFKLIKKKFLFFNSKKRCGKGCETKYPV